MRYLLKALLLTLVAFLSFSQTQSSFEDGKAVRASMPRASETGRTTEQRSGIELLQRIEGETAALNGEMRAWVLWQIGIAYEASNRTKALGLLDMALGVVRAQHENGSVGKGRPDTLAWVIGRPPLTAKLRLESDIARSIVLLEPKRADQVVEQIDPAVRGAVLSTLLAYRETAKQFDQAMETLNRITAVDEMPYAKAMGVMDTLNPDQSAELLQLFSAALVSYRDHAPHLQFRDDFLLMLSRYWKRLPKEAVRQAIDEILKQAPDGSDQGSYSVQSGKETATFGSLLEYRVSQIMAVLREFDPAAAHDYVEKYPALVSASPIDMSPPANGGSAKFRPSGGYNSIMISMAEMPSAKQAAAQADRGHADEAISDAAAISDPNLRAQTYEYIARVAAKKQGSVANDAVVSMLHDAEQLEPRQGFPYYGSAAEIYMQLGQADDARKTIEAGLAAANKLYKVDSDGDDPNAALKAFWPSTNAYCSMLRQAAHVSHTWAISLLTNIRDPEVRVAAETALAAGLLNAPIGPSTIMTEKKNGNSLSIGPRE